MDIKDDIVRYVARLARVKLSGEEVKLFAHQLGGILTYVDKLKELEIQKEVPPTSHPESAIRYFRSDETRPSLPAESVLENAPQKKGNFFKVPRIIEG